MRFGENHLKCLGLWIQNVLLEMNIDYRDRRQVDNIKQKNSLNQHRHFNNWALNKSPPLKSSNI